MEAFTPRERIGKGTEMAMLMVSSALWLIGLIPFVDWLTDPLQWLIFWLWFKFSGASISKNKFKNILSALVSLFPTIGAFIGAFPVVLYFNIKSVQKEDAAYNAAMQEQFEAEQATFEQQRISRYVEAEETEEGQGSLQNTQQYEYSEAESAQKNDGIKRYQPSERMLETEKEDAQALEESVNEDALDTLNKKPAKSREDVARLNQAAEILRTGKIPPAARSDSVLVAAYNKYQKGVREYNPNNQNPNRDKEYRFNTTNYQ